MWREFRCSIVQNAHHVGAYVGTRRQLASFSLLTTTTTILTARPAYSSNVELNISQRRRRVPRHWPTSTFIKDTRADLAQTFTSFGDRATNTSKHTHGSKTNIKGNTHDATLSIHCTEERTRRRNGQQVRRANAIHQLFEEVPATSIGRRGFRSLRGRKEEV